MSTVLNEVPLRLWVVMKLLLIFIDRVSSKIENRYLPPYILSIFPYPSCFATELCSLSVDVPMFSLCNNLVTTL